MYVRVYLRCCARWLVVGDHWITTCQGCWQGGDDLSPRSNSSFTFYDPELPCYVAGLLQVRSMDEKGAPVEQKGDPSVPVANNTPSKPRQTGHTANKKQPRAAKQLRFEAHSGQSGAVASRSWCIQTLLLLGDRCKTGLPWIAGHLN
jgi:hypothetical protein